MVVVRQDISRWIEDIRARDIEAGSSDGVMQYKTRHGCFKRGVGEDWTALEPLIADTVARGVNSTDFGRVDDLGHFEESACGQIARIEFVCDFGPHTNVIRRGAVVFDDYGNALFHAEEATLGFSTPVNSLSAGILRAVGVSEVLIDQAYSHVRLNLRDEIVFTREEVFEVAGVECVRPDRPVADTWRWFPVLPAR